MDRLGRILRTAWHATKEFTKSIRHNWIVFLVAFGLAWFVWFSFSLAFKNHEAIIHNQNVIFNSMCKKVGV